MLLVNVCHSTTCPIPRICRQQHSTCLVLEPFKHSSGQCAHRSHACRYILYINTFYTCFRSVCTPQPRAHCTDINTFYTFIRSVCTTKPCSQIFTHSTRVSGQCAHRNHVHRYQHILHVFLVSRHTATTCTDINTSYTFIPETTFTDINTFSACFR